MEKNSRAAGKNEAVSALQEMLRLIGLVREDKIMRVPVTGRYDDGTRAAVRRFQETHGLDPTGAVDGSTKDRLWDEFRECRRLSSPPAAICPFPQKKGYVTTPGEQGDLICIVQIILNDLSLHYDTGHLPLTGVMDGETEEAVKRFQQVNSLPATGQVDRATWDRMAEEYDLTCRCDEV
ncbi:MAG: peptidoglycan-binding protein, partial [Clostridia bacterium]|nr:peptidoglycan-binding protein [Clostridia bacterium]